MDGMSCGIERYIRSKHDIITDDDSADIKNSTVEISIEIIPYGDICPIVTVEGRFDMNYLSCLADNLPDQRCSLLFFIGTEQIELMDLQSGCCSFFR